MRRMSNLILCGLVLCMLVVGPTTQASEQSLPNLPACKDFAFSTEEDFLSQGPVPPDGNPLISDGDLLGRNHAVCARNRELLAFWKTDFDLGLDAVDILDIERSLVAFSTELDDPASGRFAAGDLLITNGAVIPDLALLRLFQVNHDLGLDGLQFIGAPKDIVTFAETAATHPRAYWLTNPTALFDLLTRYKVDIWISTEGTELRAATLPILDGHLLSVGAGTIAINQADLLPPVVPAGLPARGVDFGLDAVASDRRGDRSSVRFSTEILFRKEPNFTDGDVLKFGNGIEIPNTILVAPFEPKARFLGLDALYINLEPQIAYEDFLPLIFNKR